MIVAPRRMDSGALMDSVLGMICIIMMIHDTVMIIMSVMNPISLQGERRRWAALGAVLLAQLMIVLDATIVNVALPAIQTDLHFSQSSLTWVVNAYLITFGSFLLVAGRLGDLVGRRRVLLIGLAVFTAASALCGLAQGGTMLVAAIVTSAMALGVYAIVEAPHYGWASLHTLGFGSVAVVGLTLFLALEARLENPILPLRLLRMRTLAGSSVVRAM